MLPQEHIVVRQRDEATGCTGGASRGEMESNPARYTTKGGSKVPHRGPTDDRPPPPWPLTKRRQRPASGVTAQRQYTPVGTPSRSVVSAGAPRLQDHRTVPSPSLGRYKRQEGCDNSRREMGHGVSSWHFGASWQERRGGGDVERAGGRQETKECRSGATTQSMEFLHEAQGGAG